MINRISAGALHPQAAPAARSAAGPDGGRAAAAGAHEKTAGSALLGHPLQFLLFVLFNSGPFRPSLPHA